MSLIFASFFLTKLIPLNTYIYKLAEYINLYFGSEYKYIISLIKRTSLNHFFCFFQIAALELVCQLLERRRTPGLFSQATQSPFLWRKKNPSFVYYIYISKTVTGEKPPDKSPLTKAPDKSPLTKAPDKSPPVKS